METKRIMILFSFLFALLWAASNLKKASNRLEFEVFNQTVTAVVHELPFCGRSNIIGVVYENKKYNISINKNDCLTSRYRLGDTIEVIYNSRLDEINQDNFVGVYRLAIIFFILLLVVFLLYLFFSIPDRRVAKKKKKIIS